MLLLLQVLHGLALQHLSLDADSQPGGGDDGGMEGWNDTWGQPAQPGSAPLG